MDEMQKYYYNYIKRGGSLLDVPKEYITEGICTLYLKNGGSIKDIPSQFITNEMCESHVRRREPFKDIPEECLTVELCELYSSRGGTIKNIPSRFITNEMCESHVKRRRSFKDIPEECLTVELCELYSSMGGSIKNIPSQFITNEMCESHVKRGKPFKDIPEECLTVELCELYYKWGGSIKDIPSQFITKEMCERHVKRGKPFKEIPEECLTVELCELYSSMGGSIKNIPSQFITNEICESHILRGRDLKEIPEEYLTVELCELYSSMGGSIRDIPSQFITYNIYIRYLEDGGSFDEIPEEYKTEEMCIQYLLLNGMIEKIPEEFKTKEMVSFYFNTLVKKYGLQYELFNDDYEKANQIFKCLCQDKNINFDDVFEYIPKEFISVKMINFFLNKKLKTLEKKEQKKYLYKFYAEIFTKTKNVNLIPQQYLNDEIIEYAIHNSESVLPDSDVAQYLMGKQNRVIIEEEIKKELYNIYVTLKTKVSLAREYGVSIEFIDRVLNDIKSSDLEEYSKIQRVLMNNSYRYKIFMIKNLKKLIIIINSIGEISYNSNLYGIGKIGKNLSKEQKLKFAYLLETCDILPWKLHEIYECLDNEWIMKDAELSKEEYHMLQNFFKILYVDVKNESFQNLSPNEKKTILNIHSLQFLKRYKPENYFYSNEKLCKRSILDVNNNIVEITEENSKVVLEILRNNNIPLSQCIVEESFRTYFREGEEKLYEFINKLHTYDEIANSAIEYSNVNKFNLMHESHVAMQVPIESIDEYSVDEFGHGAR